MAEEGKPFKRPDTNDEGRAPNPLEAAVSRVSKVSSTIKAALNDPFKRQVKVVAGPETVQDGVTARMAVQASPVDGVVPSVSDVVATANDVVTAKFNTETTTALSVGSSDTELQTRPQPLDVTSTSIHPPSEQLRFDGPGTATLPKTPSTPSSKPVKGKYGSSSKNTAIPSPSEQLSLNGPETTSLPDTLSTTSSSKPVKRKSGHLGTDYLQTRPHLLDLTSNHIPPPSEKLRLDGLEPTILPNTLSTPSPSKKAKRKCASSSKDNNSSPPNPVTSLITTPIPPPSEQLRPDGPETATLPNTFSTPSGSQPVKKKRGSSSKDGPENTTSPKSLSTPSSKTVKRKRGEPGKDNTSSPLNPVTNLTSTPISEPSFKMTGKGPHSAQGQANGVQKCKQPNQYTKKAPPPPPPPPSKEAPAPETAPANPCDEIPHLFTSDDNLLEAIMTLPEAPPPTHSAHVLPCTNAVAHATPHNVCSSCRALSNQNLRDNHPVLVAQDKIFPLCAACGYTALQTPAAAGCTCGSAWLCARCQQGELETRQARAEGEQEFRTGVVGVGSADKGRTRCVVTGLRCACLAPLGGEVGVWKCVGCGGLVFPVGGVGVGGAGGDGGN